LANTPLIQISVKAFRPKKHVMVDPSAVREWTATTSQMTVESIERTLADVGQGAAISLQEMPKMGRGAKIPYRAAL
jgi:hypothetical protein